MNLDRGDGKRVQSFQIQPKGEVVLPQPEPVHPKHTFQNLVYEMIFETRTSGGKWFDVILLWAIILSVVVVLLESVMEIRTVYGRELNLLEWFFTILFTIEYGFRLYSARSAFRYAFSFFGVVDFLAIAPTFISLILPGAHYLVVIRILRVLRIFRILKLTDYSSQAQLIMGALVGSRKKISVFLLGVLTLVVIIGSLMYIIEGEANGFRDIPTSIYWAIVTMTTVGYGDLSPQTPLGKMLAAAVMIIGYAIIAVPTGIVTLEVAEATRRGGPRVCGSCGKSGHDGDAKYCKHCGTSL